MEGANLEVVWVFIVLIVLAVHQAGSVVGQVLEELQRAVQAVPAEGRFKS